MGVAINWCERFSRFVAGMDSSLLFSKHFIAVFLQQVAFSFSTGILEGVFNSNRLAIIKKLKKLRLKMYFFCMVVVLGWDESKKQNVTVFLLFICRYKWFNQWQGNPVV